MKSLSQSKIKSWLYCPAGYLQQYILFLNPPNPHFIMGGDKHLQVEMYHKGLKEIVDRDGKKHKFDPEKVKLYAELWPEPTYFEWVEKEFRGKEAVVLHHPSTGRPLPPMSLVFDTVKVDELIHDYKTSEASWSQAKADDVLGKTYLEGLQATIYCYAYWELTGKVLPFTFTVERKNPGVRTKPIQQVTTHRTIEDFAAFHDMATQLVRDIESAVEYICTCRDKAHKEIEVRL